MNWPHLLHWKSQKCKKMVAWDKPSLPCFVSCWNPKKIQTLEFFMVLYYCMWTFSLVYRSKNLKFKWKAVSPCCGKAGPHAEEKQQCSAIFYFGKWGLSLNHVWRSFHLFSASSGPHMLKSMQRSNRRFLDFGSNLRSPYQKYILRVLMGCLANGMA